MRRAGLTTLLLLALTAPGGSVAQAGDAPYAAVPRPQCRPGDRPDDALQGQITQADRASGRAQEGFTCNLKLVGGYRSRGFASFETYRDCAYVPDTSIYRDLDDSTYSGGVVVIDAAHPAHPVETDRLTSENALEPTESMRVNAKRGLLIMDSQGLIGAPSARKQTLDIYDVASDCRHPRHVGTFDLAPAVGHEGWFSPDGTVYWMSGSGDVSPIDVTDPAHPRLMAAWHLASSHGGASSDNGGTGYMCEPSGIVNHGQAQDAIAVVDTRSVQAHAAHVEGEPKLLAQIPLADNELCQSVYPVTYHGRPFLIQFGEATPGRGFRSGPQPCGNNAVNFAYPRIFDIGDPAHAVVAGRLMREVDLASNCPQVLADSDLTASGTTLPGQVYDVHHCSPDRLHDPTILACNQFDSGLEVYDIRNPDHPKELAYYRAGTLGSQAVLSPEWAATPDTIDDGIGRPVVRADRGEIWFTTDYTGFKVVRFEDGVYPFPGSLTCTKDYYFDQYNPGRCGCTSRRSVLIRPRGLRKGERARRIVARIGGRRVARGTGRRIRVPLAGRKGTVRVRLVITTHRGRRLTQRRRYRICATKRSTR